MTFSIPDSEISRINTLRDYTIIPHEDIDTDDNTRSFYTFHAEAKNTLEWYIRQIPGPNYIVSILSSDISGSYTYADAMENSPSTSFVEENTLYTTSIGEEFMQMNTTDIIDHVLAQMQHTQSPKYYYQFLLGCQALQRIIEPNIQKPPPYIAIDTTPGRTTKNIPIYTVDNDDLLKIKHISPPHNSIIFDINDNILRHGIIYTKAYTITPEGFTILSEILGPWQHAIIHAGIQERYHQSGEYTYNCYMRNEPWINSKTYMPPEWPGCPNFEKKTDEMSQHQWIKIQRDIESNIEKLRPHIRPT